MTHPAGLSFLVIESAQKIRAEVRRSIRSCGIGSNMILEATTASDALSIASTISLDVVLLDPATLEIPAPEFIRKLIHLPRAAAINIILLESRTSPKAPNWGVRGTLQRPITGDALRQLLLHNHALPAARPAEETQPCPAALCSLTPREQQVLKLVAEGKSSREIAATLFVTTKTVVWHRQSIMKKLDLRTIADLTKYAVRHGLTSL